MTSLNQTRLSLLVQSLSRHEKHIIFDQWPLEYDDLCSQAVALKRQHRYDESLDNYLTVVQDCTYLTTELLRAMGKVLCAMNEFTFALLLFYYAAEVKWTDTLKAPFDMYLLNPEVAKMFESQKVPTASATNYYELRDEIKKAANRKAKSIMILAKEMSGNQASYKFSKSKRQIIKECREIVKNFGL